MGVKSGYGKEKFKNGDSFEGHYLNGKFDGTGIIITIFRDLCMGKRLKIRGRI
jgi:hypothetical protein